MEDHSPYSHIITEEMIEKAAVKIDPLVGMFGCSPERKVRAMVCACAAIQAVLPEVIEGLLRPQKVYPHAQAAFINAIAEEGTKGEAIEWLQKTWNELMYLRRRIRSLKDPSNG